MARVGLSSESDDDDDDDDVDDSFHRMCAKLECTTQRRVFSITPAPQVHLVCRQRAGGNDWWCKHNDKRFRLRRTGVVSKALLKTFPPCRRALSEVSYWLLRMLAFVELQRSFPHLVFADRAVSETTISPLATLPTHSSLLLSPSTRRGLCLFFHVRLRLFPRYTL